MKILELTNYSAGICGVFARVREEASRLAAEGHEVAIFSSNFTKGSNEMAKREDKINGVLVRRFPARKLGGESFMKWNFEKEALEFSPDVIIAHAYRHSHTTTALKVAEKLRRNGKKCKVFLVTHAPFERSSTRGKLAKLAVWVYDRTTGRRAINKFDKILAITKWEIPYLLEIGADRKKIEYIPNGIPEEFFSAKKGAEENKILFLGRISPIKSLETLISAIPLIKDKKIKLEIVGPAEENYLKELKLLIDRLGVANRAVFSAPIYDTIKKIRKIDSAKIFVLPSKSEGMPQSLVEALARGKIAISSDNLAGKELISDGKNGFLFEIGNSAELAEKIDIARGKNGKKIGNEARKSVEKFNWSEIIKKIERLL